VKKVESGVTVFYVRSSIIGQGVMEIGGNGALYRASIYKGRYLIGLQSVDGQFYWRHENHLGGGYKLTSSSGVVAYRSEQDPHGNMLLETGATTLMAGKFTSYERDNSTGLDYANARMFSSSKGRFTRPDPGWLYAATMRKPQTMNRYAYADNDPANLADPTGLDPGRVCIGVCPDPETGGNSYGGGGDFGGRTGQKPTDDGQGKKSNPGKTPCDAPLPADADQLTVVKALMGEAISPGYLGQREFSTDQSGDLSDIGEPAGDVMTMDTVIRSMIFMYSVLKNRVDEGSYGNSLSAVALLSQIVGYAVGDKILSAPDFATKNPIDGAFSRCGHLWAALAAISIVDNVEGGRVPDILSWKAVLQDTNGDGRPDWVRPFNKNDGDVIRVGRTDFSKKKG
jgi:RHS repeat-associated protein